MTLQIAEAPHHAVGLDPVDGLRVIQRRVLMPDPAGGAVSDEENRRRDDQRTEKLCSVKRNQSETTGKFTAGSFDPAVGSAGLMSGLPAAGMNNSQQCRCRQACHEDRDQDDIGRSAHTAEEAPHTGIHRQHRQSGKRI